MQNAFEVTKNGTALSKITKSGEVYDKDNNLRSKKVLLWSSTTKVTDTTITLNDDFYNYDFIVIVTVTNSEEFVDIHPTPFLMNSLTIAHYSANAGQQSAINYWSALGFTYTGTKTATIGAPAYNNSNWALGLRAVYGIKL